MLRQRDPEDERQVKISRTKEGESYVKAFRKTVSRKPVFCSRRRRANAEANCEIAEQSYPYGTSFQLDRLAERDVDLVAPPSRSAWAEISGLACGFHDTWTPSPRPFEQSFRAHLDT